MAPARRRTADSLEDRVFGEPGRFNVFQLVRLLRVRDSSRPEAAGKLKRRLMWRLMSGEADTRSFARFAKRLRFTADLSPAFPGTEVTACAPLGEWLAHAQRTGEHGGVAADATLVGMLGADAVAIRTPNYCVASELGPMPEPFIEWVRDRLRDDDRTFAAFLDLFNHRLNVLRHQLKATQDVALDYALPEDTLQADYLASLAGVVSLDAEAQIALPRRAWLGMTATLADPRRAAAPALAALRQYLGVPATRLVPLIGDWRPREEASWSRLATKGTLGVDAVLGTRAWNQMAGVYLRVPDVDYARLCALLPPSQGEHTASETDGAAPESDGDAARMGYVGLAQMVRLLFDRRVDCVVALTIRAASLPPPVLSAVPGSGETAPSAPRLAGRLPSGVPYRGLRLGQTAWLGDAGRAAVGMRRVRFTIAADPAREA
jgi:predicted component of type VI protein secretion system